MDFEVSSLNVAAFGKTLAALGQKDAVWARLSPELRRIYDAPHSVKWHPGQVGLEGWLAVVAVGGEALLEELNCRMTASSFGPIVRPLVRTILIISGSSPAGVFKRMGQAVSVALRHVTFDWKPQGDHGGAFVVTYPRPMPPEVVGPGWKGVFRVGSDLTGKDIIVDAFTPESDRSFRFDVHW